MPTSDLIKKSSSALLILFFILVLPASIFLATQNQDLRQQASTGSSDIGILDDIKVGGGNDKNTYSSSKTKIFYKL